jgi:hypothetical protein
VSDVKLTTLGAAGPKVVSYAVALIFSELLAAAQALPAARGAIASLPAAFDRHPIVAAAEAHRLEQDKQFLLALSPARSFLSRRRT